jgi:hypothetical protein
MEHGRSGVRSFPMGVLARGCTDFGFRDSPTVLAGCLSAPLTIAESRTERTRATATLLHARSSDDVDRPSARWKAPSLPDAACFGLAGDSVCPCRDCRECGPSESRRRNHGQDGADALRLVESHDRVTRADSLPPIVLQCHSATAIGGWFAWALDPLLSGRRGHRQRTLHPDPE